MPDEIHKLLNVGHCVIVKSGAGDGAQINNERYQAAGATIRATRDNDFTELFNEIDVIVRFKRANAIREL